MIAALLLIASLSSDGNDAAPAKVTAVVIISSPVSDIAAGGLSFATAVDNQVRRLGDHSVAEVRQVRLSENCSLDSFATFGVDLTFCGQDALHGDVDRVLVFQMAYVDGTEMVHGAYVDMRHPASWQIAATECTTQTHAQAVRVVFEHLFRDFARVSFGAEFRLAFVFIDGHWIAGADKLGTLLVEQGRHTVEVRRAADRERLADLVVAPGALARASWPARDLYYAAR